MTPGAFFELAQEIARLNEISQEQAEEILAETGSCPLLNEEGKVVFNGRVIVWPVDEE